MEDEIKGQDHAARYAWIRDNRDAATHLLINSWQLDAEAFDAAIDKVITGEV